MLSGVDLVCQTLDLLGHFHEFTNFVIYILGHYYLKKEVKVYSENL